MRTHNTYLLALVLLALLPLVAEAGSVTVTNTVHTSANSGGNVSTGSVVEGSSKSNVSVQTVVNGQVVEDYTNESSGPIEYAHTTVLPGSAGTSSVSVSVGTSTSAKLQPRAVYVPPSEEQVLPEATSAALSSAGAAVATDTPAATTSSTTNATPSLAQSLQHVISSLIAYVFSWL